MHYPHYYPQPESGQMKYSQFPQQTTQQPQATSKEVQKENQPNYQAHRPDSRSYEANQYQARGQAFQSQFITGKSSQAENNVQQYAKTQQMQYCNSKSQLNQYVQVFQVSNQQKQSSMYGEESTLEENPYQSQSIQQRNLMSPRATAPVANQKGSKVVYMQSPATNVANKVVNYTTTSAVQTELQQQKEVNNRILQKIQQIESDISRGMSKEFLQELQQKNMMLSQMNQKLESDNQAILSQIDTTQLKSQLSQAIQERNFIAAKINKQNEEIEQWRARADELWQKLEETNEAEGQQIRELVNELENKIQGLITENERLSYLIKEKPQQIDDKKFHQELRNLKLEVEKIQLQYSNQKYEEENLKAKCKELERKYNQAAREANQRGKDDRDWTDKVNDLSEKIQLLVEENQKLQNALLDPQAVQNDITDLQDRIQIIVKENKKMVQQLEDAKKKGKR